MDQTPNSARGAIGSSVDRIDLDPAESPAVIFGDALHESLRILILFMFGLVLNKQDGVDLNRAVGVVSGDRVCNRLGIRKIGGISEKIEKLRVLA